MRQIAKKCTNLWKNQYMKLCKVWKTFRNFHFIYWLNWLNCTSVNIDDVVGSLTLHESKSYIQNDCKWLWPWITASVYCFCSVLTTKLVFLQRYQTIDILITYTAGYCNLISLKPQLNPTLQTQYITKNCISFSFFLPQIWNILQCWWSN